MSFTFELQFEEKLIENVLKDGFQKFNPLDDVSKIIQNYSLNSDIHSFLKEQGVLGILSPPKEEESTNLLLGAILARQTGRALINFPVIEHILGVYLLKYIQYEEINSYEMGEKIVTLGWGYNIDIKEEEVLEGVITSIPYGLDCNKIIVPLSNEMKGKGLLISVDSIKSSIKKMEIQDKSYTLYKIHFDNKTIDGKSIKLIDYNYEEFEKVKNLLIAAELQGIMEATLEMTLNYVKERKQFGEEIGRFQAVKHILADMYVRLKSSQVSVEYGSWAIENKSEDFEIVDKIAKSYSSEVALKNVEDAIQLHGGIGFTWEHSLHLYLKRTQRLIAMSDTIYKELDDLGSYFLDKLD